MTKEQMVDQILFTLRELADVDIELSRIDGIQVERRTGELWDDSVARTLGRAEGLSVAARSVLRAAVKNLRECLPDDLRGIVVEPLLNRTFTAFADAPATPQQEEPKQ